ncbi:MAG: T9SS type A sorting domain-containing protein, partial [Bacteroidia bacterium]|nr:T9SS type A sorting domain-containing protein [Bacteroidia bacterium]
TYTVLDLLGRTILPTQALQPDTYLDRATIGSGTFFVIIGNGEWREVERVVVE